MAWCMPELWKRSTVSSPSCCFRRDPFKGSSPAVGKGVHLPFLGTRPANCGQKGISAASSTGHVSKADYIHLATIHSYLNKDQQQQQNGYQPFIISFLMNETDLNMTNIKVLLSIEVTPAVLMSGFFFFFVL